MIKLGLAGIGRGGVITVLRSRPDVRFAAVCDPALDSDRRDDLLAARFSGYEKDLEGIYPSFEAFLEHDLDVVFIATPAPLHAAQSIAAMRAGKDVICEVPAVMSLDEARELVRAVRETGRRYFFAENCCYWGFVEAWTQMIRQGRLGTPCYIEGEYVHDVRSLMKDGNGRHTWRAELNPIRYCTHETGPIFDMIADRGESVTAMVTPSLVEPEFPAPDAGVALVRTTRGAVIKLLCCLKNALGGSFHRYLVYGTKGVLETKTTEPVTIAHFTDVAHLQGPVRLPLGSARSDGRSSGGHGGADGAMLSAFLDAMIGNRPEPIDVYRGLDYSLPGLCAAMSAEMGGTPVPIPDPRLFT